MLMLDLFTMDRQDRKDTAIINNTYRTLSLDTIETFYQRLCLHGNSQHVSGPGHVISHHCIVVGLTMMGVR